MASRFVSQISLTASAWPRLALTESFNWQAVRHLSRKVPRSRVSSSNEPSASALVRLERRVVRKKQADVSEFEKSKGTVPESTSSSWLELYQKHAKDESRSVDEELSPEERVLFRKGKDIPRSKRNKFPEHRVNKHLLSKREQAVMYSEKIKGAAYKGDISSIEKSFVDMRSTGLQPNKYHYGLLIHAHAAINGDMDEADIVFSDMIAADVEPDTVIFNTLISGSVAHGKIDSARKYLSSMSKYKLKPDPASYVPILTYYTKNKELGEAKALVSEMNRKKIEINEFVATAIIGLYSSAGDLEAAEKQFQKWCKGKKKKELTAPVWNSIILAYSRAADIENAQRYFEVMQNSGVDPDSDTYRIMVTVYGTAGEYDSAMSMWDQAEVNGVALDLRFYTALVNVLVWAEDKVEGAVLWDKINSRHIQPNLQFYEKYLQIYAKSNRLDVALAVVESMTKHKLDPDSVIVGHLVSILCASGKPNTALTMMKEVRSKGVHETLRMYNKLFEASLHSQNQINKMPIIYEELKLAGLQPDKHTLSLLGEAKRRYGVDIEV